MTTPQPGLRERKRLRVRSELIDAALKLFTRRGFEATSVDEIVARAEVSRRTFFRYFDSKEDVVLAFTDRVGDRIREELAARPHGEPPLTAVRRALTPLVELYGTEKDRVLTLFKLTAETAAIRARHLDRQDRWQRWLADEISKRLQLDAERDLQPQLVAAVALTTIDVAVRAWLAGGGTVSLSKVVDDAYAALDGGLDRTPVQTARPAAPSSPPPVKAAPTKRRK